jgi:hypothetical protein
MAFDTPEKATSAVIAAADSGDVSKLLTIFGSDAKDLFVTADPVADKAALTKFVSAARQKYRVSTQGSPPNNAVIIAGDDDWPMPIPLVKRDGKWYFDVAAGRRELLYRRIGANELNAIQVARGFVQAQREYASDIHDNSGVNQYAQRIFSSPGKHDGLYWKNPDGTAGGPIGEAVARAIQEGYSSGGGSGYHGYYFKILKGQGPAAHLGQLNYVIHGVMIGGFALVAVPVQYGVTGIKTFIVSNDGIVYQKDLGPNSLELVKQMQLYNPDASWQRTNDQWPANIG